MINATEMEPGEGAGPQPLSSPTGDLRAKWARANPRRAAVARAQLAAMAGQLEILRQGSHDRELVVTEPTLPWSLPELSQGVDSLRDYLVVAASILAPLSFVRRRRAKQVAARFNLELSPESARAMLAFLELTRARQLVGDLVASLPCSPVVTPSRAGLLRLVAEHEAVLAQLP